MSNSSIISTEASTRYVLVQQNPSGFISAKKVSTLPTDRKVIQSCCNTLNPIKSKPIRSNTKLTDLRSGFGSPCKPSQFSPNASSKVRELLTVLLTIVPRNSRFVVFTLPADTETHFEAVENYSGYIIQRLTIYLRRQYPGLYYLWIWEYQGRGALHLNVVLTHPAISDDLESELLNLWIRILLLIQRKANIPLLPSFASTAAENSHCCHVRPCWENLPGYLAKYDQKDPRMRSDGILVSPARWFGSSNNLQDRLKQSVKVTVIPCDSESDADQVLHELSAMISAKEEPNPITNQFSGEVIGITILPDDPCRSAATISQLASRNVDQFGAPPSMANYPADFMSADDEFAASDVHTEAHQRHP